MAEQTGYYDPSIYGGALLGSQTTTPTTPATTLQQAPTTQQPATPSTTDLSPNGRTIDYGQFANLMAQGKTSDAYALGQSYGFTNDQIQNYANQQGMMKNPTAAQETQFANLVNSGSATNINDAYNLGHSLGYTTQQINDYAAKNKLNVGTDTTDWTGKVDSSPVTRTIPGTNITYQGITDSPMPADYYNTAIAGNEMNNLVKERAKQFLIERAKYNAMVNSGGNYDHATGKLTGASRYDPATGIIKGFDDIPDENVMQSVMNSSEWKAITGDNPYISLSTATSLLGLNNSVTNDFGFSMVGPGTNINKMPMPGTQAYEDFLAKQREQGKLNEEATAKLYSDPAFLAQFNTSKTTNTNTKTTNTGYTPGYNYSSGSNYQSAPASSPASGGGSASTTMTLNPNQTVMGLMQKYTAEDSPWMTQARTQANADMNSRGLLNSSLATTAAQQAMYNTAYPIANADANLYYNTQKTNVDWANQNAQQANSIGAQYGLAAQQYGFNSALSAQNAQQQGGLNAQQGQINSALSAQNAQQSLAANAQDWAYKLNSMNIDAQNKVALQNIQSNYQLLIQNSSSAANMMNQAANDVSKINSNNNFDQATKDKMISQVYANLNQSLNVMGALTNTPLLNNLLQTNWSSSSGAGTSTTSDTSTTTNQTGIINGAT